MKILNITKYFYPKYGGIETRNFAISKFLAKKGYEVYVSTSKHEKNLKNFEIYEGIKIRRHKILFKAFNDVFYLGIIKDIFKFKYDIIHVDLPDPINSIFAFFASVLKSKPLFITYHADIEKEELEKFPQNLILKFYNLILKKLILPKTNAIFVTSKEYAKSSKILRNFKFKDESSGGKLILSPNFICPENLKYDEEEVEEIRKRLNLKNKKVVLFVGRLVPYKGVKYLIEAFKKVENEIDNVILLIIGDGILRKELENLAGNDNIKFLGNVKNLNPYYALCDVFVLPSITRQEAFGLVLVEAMYFEKPCITTNIDSGMKYVVDYGNAGILVKEKDVNELSKVMVKLLTNEKLRKEIGKKAKRRALENFTDKIVVEKFEKEIIKLSNG